MAGLKTASEVWSDADATRLQKPFLSEVYEEHMGGIFFDMTKRGTAASARNQATKFVLQILA